jgi:hypothetical protein
MIKLVNRARMTTATTGTGTITLGSAVARFQSFAAAGVVDGDVVRYVIEDGAEWEIGEGTYTASGTTLSRTVLESSNSDNPLNLSGNAQVFVTAVADDVMAPANLGGLRVVAAANFDGAGGVTIRSQNGFSSITRNGTGDYTCTFSEERANANYMTFISATDDGTTAGMSNGFAYGAWVRGPNSVSRSTTAFRFQLGYPADANLRDQSDIMVLVVEVA